MTLLISVATAISQEIVTVMTSQSVVGLDMKKGMPVKIVTR